MVHVHQDRRRVARVCATVRKHHSLVAINARSILATAEVMFASMDMKHGAILLHHPAKEELAKAKEKETTAATAAAAGAAAAAIRCASIAADMGTLQQAVERRSRI